ncbi:MAG: HEPN domain-containing protein [Candidatus Babeliales bacterium]|jgi:HEPN domain-containing protein
MQKHEHWLLIAQEDLDSAKHLFSASLATSLFHIQQCAEKALKAYLACITGSALKTHDLVRLVDLCMEHDARFETIRLIAAVLTPYETAGRYPDTSFKKPGHEVTQKLIEQSEYVFGFVVHHLDKQSH